MFKRAFERNGILIREASSDFILVELNNDYEYPKTTNELDDSYLKQA